MVAGFSRHTSPDVHSQMTHVMQFELTSDERKGVSLLCRGAMMRHESAILIARGGHRTNQDSRGMDELLLKDHIVRGTSLIAEVVADDGRLRGAPISGMAESSTATKA